MKRNKTSIMMALAALLMGGHAAAQSSDAQLPEFVANLVYETDINNSLDNLRGIYKFKPAQTIQLDTVYVSTMMNANGGGVFRNDLFQFINYYDPGSYMPVQCAIYECYFAADGTVHWDRDDLRYGAEVPEELAAVNGMLIEDPASGELYGIYEANYGYSSMLARVDIDNLTREDIGELEQYYMCIACDYQGNLYGIDDYGVLYQINKQTGEETGFGPTMWIRACALTRLPATCGGPRRSRTRVCSMRWIRPLALPLCVATSPGRSASSPCRLPRKPPHRPLRRQ